MNYTNMAAGTGDMNASLDYNEVSGQVAGTGKTTLNRPKGMRANAEVFKKS